MSNLDFENEIWDLNYSYICGLDEVGRGCLAGPVYSGAVVLKKDQNTDDALFKKINDSKKLTENSRESLVQYIKDISIDTAIGICTNEEIDDLGIQSAVKTSMNRAINNLNVSPDYLLVDSLKLDNKIPQKNIIRGDQASKSIAAASIIAKVARDKFMVQDLSEKFPNYYFNKNKGYGTKVHMEAIKEFGITNSHRKSFEPIKSMLKG
ncbi:MAG: ribonuclease HII [Dehalococcoidia bacterium]|jgi:ribonuclease HII|nr:ribonuclease HII [Dehalococcoidia bacterium]|tara:strand:+ start:1174 stop:1797 length:624 start_codon:yes stop_codon:yes gene_type:complete